ncbi:MAG: thioredoxin domain-containing protein [Planctomycetaceae bacterium]|nr:thioredoxin domain-containing protein [Planctomycetaceae bacterium]
MLSPLIARVSRELNRSRTRQSSGGCPVKGRPNSGEFGYERQIAALLSRVARPVTCALFMLLTTTLIAAEPNAKPPANRLARETSPYLLLHAHNPVDWYPWGDEALARAKREQKLIFLSVGYSSCYWCHVMERESFMDAEIAAYLNKHFVCIKVDREERPDIDEIYMEALHATNRSGGWPLTMILTPEAKPFYGGTYFPPRDKDLPNTGKPDEPPQRMIGLQRTLTLLVEKWEQQPDELREIGTRLSEVVRRRLAQLMLTPTPLPGPAVVDELIAELASDYDEQHGGFGFSEGDPNQSKFPQPSKLLFLADRVQRTGHERAKHMLLGTLDHLSAGGIRDHLGGGFHRYSTDRAWAVPHFEKMLYDNGQLATVYAAAFALTGNEVYRETLDELCGFVLRELTSPDGGFYAALDAETDAEEGRYYVWTRDEITKLLAADEYQKFAPLYALDREANFERRWVLLWPRTPNTAQRSTTAGARAKLLAARNERKRPLTDTKILTAWNGLMIRGLADAGRVLKRDDYRAAAERAAELVLAKLVNKQGHLLRTYTAGEARLNGYLDDYALFVDGLLALHRATGNQRWLDESVRLTDDLLARYWDKSSGGFFYTSDDHETLIARSKDVTDSALPSSNAVAADNLVYLARATGEKKYRDRAEQTLTAFATILARAPGASPRMVSALTALRALDADEKERNR